MKKLLVCLALCMSCGTRGDQAVEQIVAAIPKASKAHVATYQFAQELCLRFAPTIEDKKTCVQAVRDASKDAIEAFEAIRVIWCQIDTEAQLCKEDQ